VPSKAVRPRYGERTARVAGVERGCGLEQEHVHLIGRDGAMLRAARNDEELALANGNRAVAKLHGERAGQNQKELVLSLVAVPDEGPTELGDLDMLAIELSRRSSGPSAWRTVRGRLPD
jgi:hypothetical protein